MASRTKFPTVPPQAADLEQPSNVIPQWLFKMLQIQAKPHPKALCQPDIIYTNGTA
jgi:hypothetical protein